MKPRLSDRRPVEPGAILALAVLRPAIDETLDGDRTADDMAFEPRHVASPVRTKASLDDLAHIALCALRCSVALIVIDGAKPDWVQKRIGVAVTPSTSVPSDRDPTDWARMAYPLFASDAGYGFYAAVPLRDGAGTRIGTLAVLGDVPRAVSEDELTTFRKLAGMVERLV